MREVYMTDRIRGILAVVQTAWTDEGELDEQSMERQVAFCIAAGAHGLVYPVLASEYQFLSDKERQRLVKVVVGAAAGTIPVIAGVASPAAAVAAEHAAHARRAGAAAVIAMPPNIAAQHCRRQSGGGFRLLSCDRGGGRPARRDSACAARPGRRHRFSKKAADRSRARALRQGRDGAERPQH